MSVNLGFFVNKLIKVLNRPALRNCVVDRTSKIGAGSNCINVKVGRYSYMGKNNSVSNVEIGAFCSIASYCAIGGGAHSLDTVSTSPVFQKGRNILKKNFANIDSKLNKKVVIENDVWIGENVFINDGVIIGNGAVVGAHSVVTHDVPPYAIVAGAPARIVRFRFSEDEIKRLCESKWWDLSDDELTKIGNKFKTIQRFLNEEK